MYAILLRCESKQIFENGYGMFTMRWYYYYSCTSDSKITNLKLYIMKKNMGGADRIIRLIIAAVIGYLYYNGTIAGTLGYVLLAVAAIFTLTALISSCPLYSIIGINTCKVKS